MFNEQAAAAYTALLDARNTRQLTQAETRFILFYEGYIKAAEDAAEALKKAQDAQAEESRMLSRLQECVTDLESENANGDGTVSKILLNNFTNETTLEVKGRPDVLDAANEYGRRGYYTSVRVYVGDELIGHARWNAGKRTYIKVKGGTK